MERTGYPTAASAAMRRCVWPVSAILLALTHTAGPAHALLEGGSSAPLPTVETAMAAPQPEFWLSPPAHARQAWRRAVCAGPGYPGGDLHFADYARSASGTLVPAAMTAAVLPYARPRLVRPVRRPSYVLAAHLIPRDPATVRPVRRPLPEPVMVARMWQGPVVRTAGFGSAGLADGLWGDSSSIALWRASLCDDAEGTTTMGGFGPVPVLLPADAPAVPARFARPADPPAPVPRPAPLRLLLTACAALALGRRFPLLRRRA